MRRYPAINEGNKIMILRLHRQADLRLCWSQLTLCRFSHNMAKFELKISDTTCIRTRIFSKTYFFYFLFELSKFISLVRDNHTVKGNQCRKGQYEPKARHRHKVTSRWSILLLLDK